MFAKKVVGDVAALNISLINIPQQVAICWTEKARAWN